MTARLLIGDVFKRMAELPDGSVDLVLTSPPFLALRSYLPADHPDKAKEIGSEPTPAAFLDTLLALTAEWRRVLAPHGSICVELGDTYAGSGNGGKTEQEMAAGDHRKWVRHEGRTEWERQHPISFGEGRAGGGHGWPLPKSLCGIPHLYHLSLAYGRNLLTGQESPAGQWRVRNVVAWCRPNPPVGALGDKFRPGTSYMTVACVSGQRYFDLDAVRSDDRRESTARNGSPKQMEARINGATRGAMAERSYNAEGGAPPLDWWEIPTQPYAGSHYATWPAALCTRPILAMCPQKVCTTCGEPSRRIVSEPEYVAARQAFTDEARPGIGFPGAGQTRGMSAGKAPAHKRQDTLGWSDCGHGSVRCSSCHVLVPFDHALRRPGSSTTSEAGVGSAALLAEPLEGQGESTDDAGRVRGVRRGLPGPAGGEVLHAELFGEVGAPGGPGEHYPTPDTEPRPAQDDDRVRAAVGAPGNAGTPQERPDDGAPATDAGTSRPAARAVGDRSPSQRGEGRQPLVEPRGGDEGEARRNGDLPPLSGDVPRPVAGYVCPCGSTDVEYVADHWRTGLVLDPFAGSGTTLAVATGHGRDAIGIDLDARNADLCSERVGMFLEIDEQVTPVP